MAYITNSCPLLSIYRCILSSIFFSSYRVNFLYHCRLCVISVAITFLFILLLKTVFYSILSVWHDEIFYFTHLSGVNIVYLTDCRALTADRFLLPELVGDNRGLGISATKQQWKNQQPSLSGTTCTSHVNNSQVYITVKGFESTTTPNCCTLQRFILGINYCNISC